jgi:hypothetical protein
MKIVVAILSVLFGLMYFASKADDHMETMNDFKEEK